MMNSERLLRHSTIMRNLPFLSGSPRPFIASPSRVSMESLFRCFVPAESFKSMQWNRCRSLSSHTHPASASGEEIFSMYKGIELEGNNVAYAMEMLAKADAVCFDVDSTVVTEEGIDVLADTLGKGPEVSAWTVKAMNGNIKFEDALAARLDIIQPSRSDISACIAKHPLSMTPGIDRLVEALRKRGTHVYLVSGGFRLMIEPVAKALGMSSSNIYANTILFDDEGHYIGFDTNEPTSADLGKPKTLTNIKTKYGYETMIMVGDGATDAQAKPPADAFIGFGGVVVRESVRQKACWFVKDFQTMIDIVSKFGGK